MDPGPISSQLVASQYINRQRTMHVKVARMAEVFKLLLTLRR